MKLNKIQIVGRLGQDAKIIDHQGRKFVAFTVGVDEGYKDRNGTKVDKVVWYDCATEQDRFFKVTEWLTKGREVYVDGKPSVRTYEKDNKTYANIRIQIDTISLGNLPTGQTASTPAPAATKPAPAPAGGFNHQDDDNNDLPF